MKIEIQSLDKTYQLSHNQQLTLFSGLNLTIASGSFTVIIGESGCGKSTLLNLIAGLSQPTSGQVLADDREVVAPSPERTLIFQKPSLLPWLTVRENIAFGCTVRGDKKQLRERTQKYINLVGLNGFENIHPSELSVGMAQRVSLARALMAEVKVLLLDEPFGSLDTFNRSRLQGELIQIWQERRFTTILVTHDIDEALAVGQKIIFLGGRPCSVQSIYDIDLPYPRDISSHDFFQVRSKTIKELQFAIQHFAHNLTSLPTDGAKPCL